MTLEEIKAQFPDVYGAIFKAGQQAGQVAGYQQGAQEWCEIGQAAGRAAGLAEGATAEATRIAEIRAVALPGHEALVAELIADGKTTGPEAAVKILQAEKALSASRMAAFNADGTPVVPNGQAPQVLSGATGNRQQASTEKPFMVLVDEYVAANSGVSRGDAIQAVAHQNPKAHEAYVASLKGGA